MTMDTPIEQRIRFLVTQLNTKQLNKKQRRVISKELVGYGVIPVRSHKRNVTVDIGLGLKIYDFPVDKILETTEGKLIGYYCPDCFAVASVKDAPSLILPDDNCMRCMYCNSLEVTPIFSDSIVEEGVPK